MQLVGNSEDKELVNLIFGSMADFLKLAAESRHNFFYKKHKTTVIQDKETGIYEFFVA